jgi:hypothetical protein
VVCVLELPQKQHSLVAFVNIGLQGNVGVIAA